MVRCVGVVDDASPGGEAMVCGDFRRIGVQRRDERPQQFRRRRIVARQPGCEVPGSRRIGRRASAEFAVLRTGFGNVADSGVSCPRPPVTLTWKGMPELVSALARDPLGPCAFRYPPQARSSTARGGTGSLPSASSSATRRSAPLKGQHARPSANYQVPQHKCKACGRPKRGAAIGSRRSISA